MSILYIIGVDEVGRGPLAGPLCVGACLLERARRKAFSRTFAGIKDSKQLSAARRREWLLKLKGAQAKGECRLCTAFVSEKVIDARGLSFALKRAICRVLRKLNLEPNACTVLLDGGMKAPRTYPFQQTIINGDETEQLIAGASIVAKVRRDRYMMRLSKRYPLYGFDSHKGYGTKAHYEALRKHGVSEIHRKSFLKNFLAS